VPIGSLGDGIWRMLALAIAITQCKGGLLLVDEIDTGLHHKVMSDMWRFLRTAANDLEVQVFATSHSFDCVHSLASICVNGSVSKNEVTIQRIENGKTSAIPYTEAEVRIASERNIEVR
jgi:predicted ATP-dependent endonuclease of OLD family